MLVIVNQISDITMGEDNKKYHIEFISINLTDCEFRGFCKGMELVYYRRAQTREHPLYAIKSIKWWKGAYSKHRHNCVDNRNPESDK